MSSVFSPTPDRLAALLSDSTMFTADPESPDISYGLDIGTKRRTETGWSRLPSFTHYEARACRIVRSPPLSLTTWIPRTRVCLSGPCWTRSPS